jgi:NAD(P)-dependent dehydrogenase (short-subunit alcohol dehydrogenase family)
MIHFDGRVAVVTGGAGGLGRTYCLDLAARGARVVVNDLGAAVDGSTRDLAPANAVVAEIEAAGGTAIVSPHSVSTPEGGEAIVADAIAAFGRVDVVISNAGTLRDRTFAKLDWPDLDAVLDVHLKGAFYVLRPAFLRMREQGYGRIVLTSSNAGVFGNFGQSNYGAAKAGLVGLANVLAIEGERFGIGVNTVMPIARTRMTEAMLGDLADQLGPERVVPLVTYLASEECATTHGLYSAAGGRYARVFAGLTPGWVGGPNATAAEDIAAHVDDITALDGYIVPLSVQDEFVQLRRALGLPTVEDARW